MIEINRNSYVVRNVNFESKEFKNINYNYSLYDKVVHKYTFTAFTKIDNDLYFPSSMGIEELKKYFPKEDIITNYKTTAKADTISYNMKHQPRDDLQKNAISFLMAMKDDDNQRERFLSLATGSGKTFVTIYVVSKFKKKPFIIVDTLELADQWKREFLNHSNLKEDDIVILSGSEIVEKEKKKPSAKAYIAIHRTLGNMMEEDYNSINILMNKLKIGIRVFDEAHVNFKNVCMINSLSNVEYTIFLTATPSRSNFTDDYLYGKLFRRIPYFNGKDISDEKYHTVVLYKMDSKPSLEEKIAVKTKYGFNASRWASFIEETGYEFFWESLEEIIEKFKLKERNMKVAIMLPTISLIKKVQKGLEELGLEVGIFIGEVKKEDREEALKKKFILTNDKIFDKGIDVKDLEILINYVPFGSLVKTEQIIGRLRYGKEKASILIDVTDIGYEECLRQMKLRKRFYKKKAKKIIEIEK
jgi:superfamily II DNA or RNA helicase